MDLYLDEMASPVGIVHVVSDGDVLRAVDFQDYESRMHRLLTRHYGNYTLHPSHPSRVRNDAVARLTEYFAGDLRAIDGLSVATNGTEFQQQVWAALREIVPGTCVSYGTIASRIGCPKASRAVGLANGSNPISIIVPCHRVIGANKSLTGYGGGLHRKQWLLKHEGVQIDSVSA